MARSRGIVLVRYRTTMEKVRSNVVYIGFRARETEAEERGFFNEKLDRGADYECFLGQIEHHPALQHTSTVKAHSMILSVKDDDYKQLLENGVTLKDLAREMMSDLQREKEMKLEWIGAVHEKSGHPHVHLAVMSVGVDEQGKNRRLYLSKDDVNELRRNFDKMLDRHAPERNQSLGPSNRPERRSPNRSSRGKVGSIFEQQHHAKHAQENKQSEKRNKKRRKKRARSRMETIQQQPTAQHGHDR